ncbi:protein crumbs homolog 1-like [Genypterus blacodes]|uniref:protein crumbs homolog 1-like n=1 Tax=Genypterus blacodes TaxID=154954 RepID=UPI003F75CDA2
MVAYVKAKGEVSDAFAPNRARVVAYMACIVDDLLLSIKLLNGHLSLWSLRGQGSSTLVQELPEYMSNNRWHTVAASLGGVVSLIRLICTEGSCTRGSSTEIQLFELTSDLPKPGPVHLSLFIGAGASWASGKALEEADTPAAFRGCFRDVFVDSHLVVPVMKPTNSSAQKNVTLGCSDKDKCDDSPCQNRGRCMSQGWRSYTCECHRPYEGTNCAEEFFTARFGSKDLRSYAVFTLDDRPEDTVTLSMFIRTRQTNGLLLILSNSTGQYLRLWLEEGRVKVQLNNFETLIGQGVVSDGHFHLVTVKLEGTAAVLLQSSQNQGSVPIRRIQVHPGDAVYVGGLPDPRASATFGGYFKGCVQDLRINDKHLQFYPILTFVESYNLEQLVNVGRGCSSDNACAVNPCLNGGVCYSMWDDFICNCPPNTAGQRCEEVKWCELSPCPSTATCRPQSYGFECLSNVTFRSESGILHFRDNGVINRNLSSVILKLRTRQPDATLLHAQRGLNYLSISLRDSHLHMELQAEVSEDSHMLTLQTVSPISNGVWHTVELSMEDQSLQTSRWIMAVDGGKVEVHMSDFHAGNLDFLRNGTDIFLGGQSLDAGVNFSGCLGPVEIGGLLLPFHGDTELNLPRPQEEQFVRMSENISPHYGCWGADVCAPNPCQNKGVCEDLFDMHHCRCPPDWAGLACQEPADTCASNPCVHGNCTTPSEGYECVCELGYKGRHCEIEVDMCENSHCRNGSTCLRGFHHYTCLCPQNMTGQYCNEKIPELPWYIEFMPLPQLPVSSCQGTKWNYSCFNGGICSDVENACDCTRGFTGHWCEKDVDECASEPCWNGGFCINYINSYECVCDLNHTGVHCQIDVSDFYLYVFLGLWQNLFQLVSYLVLRLDDGPEVEWAFYIED